MNLFFRENPDRTGNTAGMEPLEMEGIEMHNQFDGDLAWSFNGGPSITHEEVLVLVKKVLRISEFRGSVFLNVEDVVHEWYVAYRDGKFVKYDPQRSPLPAFVYGTLKHICHDIERKNRRLRPMPSHYETADDRCDPVRQTVRREVNEGVRREIDALPPADRRAVRRGAVGGRSSSARGHYSQG